MAEHAAAGRNKDAGSQTAAHSTGPGHIFKFDEAKLLARGVNRVNRELLGSLFSDPQSNNKRNEHPFPYSVLRHRLSREMGQVESTRVTDDFYEGEPNCRDIITPASNMDDKITAIYDSDADGQAVITLITTPAVITWPLRTINTALIVPLSPFLLLSMMMDSRENPKHQANKHHGLLLLLLN
ncbi:unnamed protein product [Schistocephalus solidus]|uniref:RNAse_A_bac domain-containing protein n=1 Tax=Schistocephalus solidus TaxID=70667 RepID=A0A183T9N2_SCHSO|nr:unnamed protein product [Schistocephalus solidus]